MLLLYHKVTRWQEFYHDSHIHIVALEKIVCYSHYTKQILFKYSETFILGNYCFYNIRSICILVQNL